MKCQECGAPLYASPEGITFGQYVFCNDSCFVAWMETFPTKYDLDTKPTRGISDEEDS